MTYEDSEKLRALYRLYEQPMYRIAFAVLHDAALAEDAVSDAFMRIIDKLGRLDSPDSRRTKAYIVRTVKSVSISIYRKNKRRTEREINIDDDTVQYRDPKQDVEGYVLEHRSRLEDVLDSIGETDRRIVLLRCRDELSWREVSEKMSITEATARKRFERARKRIMKGEIHDE